MPGWTYDIVLGWITEEDLKEISDFPDPTPQQADAVIKNWEYNYVGQNIMNLEMLEWAKGIAKLYIKCKHVYPEKFI